MFIAGVFLCRAEFHVLISTWGIGFLLHNDKINTRENVHLLHDKAFVSTDFV